MHEAVGIGLRENVPFNNPSPHPSAPCHSFPRKPVGKSIFSQNSPVKPQNLKITHIFCILTYKRASLNKSRELFLVQPQSVTIIISWSKKYVLTLSSPIDLPAGRPQREKIHPFLPPKKGEMSQGIKKVCFQRQKSQRVSGLP